MSTPEPLQSERTSSFVPLASSAVTGGVVSRRKQPKSRNGCITCKARRMKCDEKKPSCQQCSRRGITCGGYPNFLRWRPMAQGEERTEADEDDQSVNERLKTVCRSTKRVQSEGSLQGVKDQAQSNLPVLRSTRQVEEPGASVNSRTSPTNALLIPPSFDKNQVTTLRRYLGEAAGTNVNAEIIFDDNSVGLFDIQQSNAAFHQIPQLDDLVLHTDGTVPENDEGLGWNLSNPEAAFGFAEGVSEEGIDEAILQMPELSQNVDASTESQRRFVSSLVHPHGIRSPAFHQQPQSPSATPEVIKHFFEHQTCEILSIKADRTENLWWTFVWPLSFNYPVLHDALAAMACLYLSKSQPHLRLPGLRYMQDSTRALIDNEDNGKLPLTVSIATRLALGFAEEWDYQKPSTGIDHINRAKELVRRAASEHQASSLTDEVSSRLSFLANTCLYMDVIARLTCADFRSVNNAEFIAAYCSLNGLHPNEQYLDPLMGCAITLFPTIGRLAELVGRVRRRTENRNSPAIISEGIELRVAIERWSPPLDCEDSADPDSCLSDSIQTAEAYRWASLLLLRQAVPEIPWTHSFWDMAQKVLVFLATVPLSSPTIIVHVFPLVMAGCEAFDEDDRDWALKRWTLMSKRMVTGVVDCCRQITTQVWRRRDEYEARHGIQHVVRSAYSSSLTTDISPNGCVMAANANGPSRKDADVRNRPNTEGRPRSSSSDFPVSAAFKKGIDPVTRAGFIDYTSCLGESKKTPRIEALLEGYATMMVQLQEPVKMMGKQNEFLLRRTQQNEVRARMLDKPTKMRTAALGSRLKAGLKGWIREAKSEAMTGQLERQDEACISVMPKYEDKIEGFIQFVLPPNWRSA